jgi:hypothetical protein
VDRGHETTLDAERVVDHLGHRREAVRGAARVRDDRVLGRVVLVVVDTEHDGEVFTLGRSRDDDLLGAAVHVRLGLARVGEQTGRLDHHVGAEVAPGQLARVALFEHLEGLAPDGDVVGRGLHLVAETAQDAVVLEQVRQRGVVGEVIDGNDFDVGALRQSGTEEVAADPAEAVDTNPDGH